MMPPKIKKKKKKLEMYYSCGYGSGYVACNILREPHCMMTFWDVYATDKKEPNKDFLRMFTFKRREKHDSEQE